MGAREKEIQAFVYECTQLRRLIQDKGFTEEQYRYLKSRLETLLTDLSINHRRQAFHRTA